MALTGVNEFENGLASLATDPVLAPFVHERAALLIFDPGGQTVLWASPAADAIRQALVLDPDGRLEPALPVAVRLRALAAGLAPRSAIRLERVRFSSGEFDPPTTCACRLVTFPSGREALLLAIVGPMPRFAPKPSAGGVPSSDPGSVAVQPSPERRAESGAGRAPTLGRTVRFAWQADVEGRFTQVSQTLAGIVGATHADIIGRTWKEIVGILVEDPSGRVAECFDRRESWSGHTILWGIDPDLTVSVDLAGLATYGPDRELSGFRGFGLIRPNTIAGRTGAHDPIARPVEPGPPVSEPAPPQSSPPVGGASKTDPPPKSERRPPADGADRIERGDASAGDAQGAARGGTEPPPGPDVDPSLDPRTSLARGLHAGSDTGPGVTAPRLRTGERPSPGRERLSATTRLSTAERSAFREIARALGARFSDEPTVPPHSAEQATRDHKTPSVDAGPAPPPVPAQKPGPDLGASAPTAASGDETRLVLDRLPTGVLIHRGEELLFANRALLDLVGCADEADLANRGGVGGLFQGRPEPRPASPKGTGPTMELANRHGETVPVEIELTTLEWKGSPASLMTIRSAPDLDFGQRARALERDLLEREARLRELSSILDTATDGVVVTDDRGRILSLNRSAEALFGYDQRELAGDRFAVLFAPESQAVAVEYLESLRANGVASLLNDGREVLGRVRQGGSIPLSMTIGRIADSPDRRFCAVLRDISAAKKTERDLLAARQAADDASARKSDFLATISHEIRTPLNAIIGFAEIMLEERFGPVGTDRYKEYLSDIRASGGHVVSLVNDLLDLAKAEAGRADLSLVGIDLNEIVSRCVGLMQAEAARARIVVRTSFAMKLPQVVGDDRSLRQIALNLVSNAIRFTEAGGQVIVSTAASDTGEVTFRIRDTGIGMSNEEIEAALEPFRQVATARRSGGSGLGLPLTKALVIANGARLQITSARQEGTLVEVVFPSARVLSRERS